MPDEPGGEGGRVVPGRQSSIGRVLSAQAEGLEASLQETQPFKVRVGIGDGIADRGDGVLASRCEFEGQPVGGASLGIRADRDGPPEGVAQ